MITHTSDHYKSKSTKLCLSVLQSTILIMFSLVLASQADAQTVWCANNANGYTTPGSPGYHVQMFFLPSTLPQPDYGCVHYYSGTNYVVTWSQSVGGEDFLPGMGILRWNVPISSARTTAQAYHHHELGTNSGRAYFGLYGRMLNTTTEWYIVEDWSGSPQPWNNGGLGPILKTATINNVKYDIYEVMEGPTKSIQQWWSVRETPSTNEWVPYISHFQAWEGTTNGSGGRLASSEILGDLYYMVEINKPGSGSMTTYSLDMTSYPPTP